MRYISTRHGSQGNPAPLSFQDVMLAGLARDGGLYLPESWPHFSKAEIAALKGKPYAEVAFRVMQPFVGDSFERDIVPANQIGMKTTWLVGDAVPANRGVADQCITSLDELTVNLVTTERASA